MSKAKNYNLSDQTIGQIVQLIQLGILTGTDISDQMRTLRVVLDEEENSLDPCPEYMKVFSLVFCYIEDCCSISFYC